MMDFETMRYMMGGGTGYGFMFFGWIVYLLLIILMALSIIALVKYINKK